MMDNRVSVKGKVVLLTGATAGIGRELLFQLLRLGAKVAFCGRSEEKIKKLIEEIGDEQLQSCYYETFCLSNEDSIIGFVKGTIASFNQIDILINCAGLNSARAEVAEIRSEDLDWMLAINLKAPFILMREVSRSMKERREGMIVNILSTVCLFSNKNIGAYTASKAGFEAITKVARKELREYNIKVTAVYPGGVNTGFRTAPNADYLSPESVAQAIINSVSIKQEIALDEVVLRPMVEQNF